MIAVDTNILVYAYDESSPEHAKALAAMGRLVREPAWGLPWIVAGEFYSVLTDARRWRVPQMADAIAALSAWIATPGARLLAEPPGHWERLQQLLASAQSKGGRGSRCADRRRVPLGRGERAVERDRDFSWYPQLRVRNPLVD